MMSTSPELAPQQTRRHSRVVFAPLSAPREQQIELAALEGTASHAAGYAAGWAQGTAAARTREERALAALREEVAAEKEQLRQAASWALVALENATDEMRRRTAPTVDAAADTLATAAVDLAEVIIGHDLQMGSRNGELALSRALAAAPEHADVTVRLNAADLAVVRDVLDGPELDALLAGSGASRRVVLAADPALRSGDAEADFPGGRVDARIATALGRMREALRAEVRG